MSSKVFPLRPKHPERICWGCDKYCRDTDLQCGNGSIRIAHPCEDFGDEWFLQDGDWSGLLSEKQQREIDILRREKAAANGKGAKPHIVLPVKKRSS